MTTTYAVSVFAPDTAGQEYDSHTYTVIARNRVAAIAIARTMFHQATGRSGDLEAIYHDTEICPTCHQAD